MKQYKLLYLVPFFLFCITAGCSQQKHNRQKKEIEKERRQQQSLTADISEAVKATDEAGWDSVAAFRKFHDHANASLEEDRKEIAAFRFRASKGSGENAAALPQAPTQVGTAYGRARTTARRLPAYG